MALGDNAYVAAMQGAPNDETQFLLDRFGFQAPTLHHQCPHTGARY